VIVKIDDKEIAGARQGSSAWRSDMPKPAFDLARNCQGPKTTHN